MTSIGGSFLSVPTARNPPDTAPILTELEEAFYIAATSGLLPPTSLYLTVATLQPDDLDKETFSELNKQKHHWGTAKPVVVRVQPIPTSDKQYATYSYEEKFESVAQASEAYSCFGGQDRFHQATKGPPSLKGHAYAKKTDDVWNPDSEYETSVQD